MDNSLNLKNKVKVIALNFDGVITNLNVDWNSAIRSASTIAGYNIKSLLTFYESSQGTPIFQKVSGETGTRCSEERGANAFCQGILTGDF
jgi:hypothetical protein